MFIVPPFTKAKTWKQLRHPSTDEGTRRYGTHIQWNITQP